MRRIARAVVFASIALFLIPALVAAHPLGNFTINHYAGLRIEPDRVLLDVVIDQAEIPAFQARQALDTNQDGEVSDAELEAGRVSSCTALADDLALSIAGHDTRPSLTAAGLELRPGVGGDVVVVRGQAEQLVPDTPAGPQGAEPGPPEFLDDVGGELAVGHGV